MPYLLLSLAAIFWGGNYVVGKLMVVHLDPVLLSQARWLITSVLLLLINYRVVKASLPAFRSAWFTIVMLAVCGQVLFPLTLYIGLQYTSSLNAAIYLSATPCLVLALNRFVFGDFISLSNVVGVIISTAGVLWLVSMGHLADLSFLEGFNRGDVWTMASALSWAVYCSFLRTKPTTITGSVFVTFSAVIGALCLIPFTLNEWMSNPAASFDLGHGLAPWLGLAYLVIFPSWLSYLFWSKGIGAIGATRGEIFTHLVPLSGGVISIMFLNVQLHGYHVVSLFLIGTGVVLCSVRRRAPVPLRTEAA
jgi:drug/metabolite transporter (DMT)-like permease